MTTTNTTQNETVTLSGVLYNVIQRETPADFRAKGLCNIADMLDGYGVKAQVALQRPRGAVITVVRDMGAHPDCPENDDARYAVVTTLR